MISIILEGGLVSAVISDKPEEVGEPVNVVDYDTEGADDADLYPIVQESGKGQIVLAHAGQLVIEKSRIAAYNLIDPYPED